MIGRLINRSQVVIFGHTCVSSDLLDYPFNHQLYLQLCTLVLNSIQYQPPTKVWVFLLLFNLLFELNLHHTKRIHITT